MRLPRLFPLLELVALAGLVSSSGAPRASIDGVPPVFDIAESYIRSQTDGSAQPIGYNGVGNCSSKNPCILGSCCNNDGQCGYRPEHCSPSSPKTCVANCDAKAPCGEYSADGKTSCPLNVCCSRFGFCGTSDVFCKGMDAIAGADGATNDPSCGKNSGSVSRRIAYYQSWNSRTRGCDKVWPDQLNLSGTTHLVLAFATIDPKTFKVGMMDPADEDIYKQFLALPGSVSKWLGIGGFQFTDPGPTQHTFSDMTSSQENRKAFIDSLQQFLFKWKFSGVDIDWEWPGHLDRGGSSQDGANQVLLFKEMRQAFVGNVGLGVVIPAQYEYMQHIDLKGLEAQVDWLTILTYDLHGPWDATTQGLGPKIKPHTDLKEIDLALKPLWSSQIGSKKINMGIANYGRGYTVADKNCAYYGCAFTGPSTQGSCTTQSGVLSSCEIRRIISDKHLSWKIIDGGAEANEVTWDDQWVSWDDAGTLAKKLELANDRCLGGTALWAIDYDVCPTDGGSPQPGLPGSSAAPSQPASSMTSASQPPWSSPSESLPASSQPSWSAPPRPSQPAWSASPSAPSQPSWSAPSTLPSGSQSSSIGPSSAAPSSPASSTQGSSQVGPSSSGDSSSAAPVGPVPSSELSSAWSATSSSAPWTSSAPASSVAGSSVASSTGSSASSGAAKSSSSSDAWTAPVSSDSGSSSNAWTPPASSSSPGWSSSQAVTSGQISTTGQSGTSWAWSSSGSPPPASSDTSSQVWTSSGATTSGATITTNSASQSGSIGATASASSSQDSSAPWNSWNNPSTSSSSRAQSASWVSSSAAQTSSGAVSSSTSPSSSAAASSGSSTPGSSAERSSAQSSAQSSAAQSSGAQSSGAQSSGAQSSAAQSSVGHSSAAQTSKPAESSRGATSGSGDTTTTPPPAQSTTTGVVATSSALPPSSKTCPDLCWDQDWCKDLCSGKDFIWPPPVDCWYYDWCRLWWGFTDNKIDERDGKKCKILGCGCGWMGLPWGPGCPAGEIEIPWFIKIVIDLFGGLFPERCLFWGCEDKCGIFGCFGFCFGQDGCDLCPKEICPNGGPEKGPIPKDRILPKPAVPTIDGKPPKKCEPQDYKTATERFVFCHDNVDLSSGISVTTVSTWASTTVSTVTSSTSTCETPMNYVISGCNVIDHLETKTVSQTKSNTLSSETPGPACTRAPLSLDDDEGNNIPLDWDSSSSIFASNTTNFASQTSISASFTSSTSSTSRSSSSSPTSSTTQVSSSLEIGTSSIVKPTPSPGPMDKNGQWNVTIHIWFENKGAKIEWELYDPNKNKAGEGKMDPKNSEGDIETYIESYPDRAEEHHMPFAVKAWFRHPFSIDDAVVQFVIQKEVPNCPKSKDVPCQPNMQTENKWETQKFQVDSCYQYCSKNSPQNQLLKPSDLNCDDMNDADWQQNGNAWMRNFNCYWKCF